VSVLELALVATVLVALPEQPANPKPAKPSKIAAEKFFMFTPFIILFFKLNVPRFFK